MRSSLKERIVDSLSLGVLLFIFLLIVHKFYTKMDGVVAYSAIWCIVWSLGCFISKTLSNREESLWKTIGFELIIILIAFVFGFIFNIPNWKDFVLSFGLSILINNKWIKY